MNSSPIIRSDDLRAQNRHRILRTLRRTGPLSRARAGELTGLSQASLSTLIGVMTEQGMVTSSNRASSGAIRRGRPQTTLALRADAALAATVGLTIDRLQIRVVDYVGNTNWAHEVCLDTRKLRARDVIKSVSDNIQHAMNSLSINSVCSISIGFQGATNNANGALLSSPIIDASSVPIGTALQAAFDAPVTVNNDCLLIAKALHNSEHALLGDDFATVLFSHGVGMGLYIAGEPFSGAQSSALELGHIQHERDGAQCRCGKRGCIEAYASDYALLRAANGISSGPPAGQVSDAELQGLVEKANNGDQLAIDAFAAAGRAIGEGLVSVFTLLDPMPVALVGHSDAAYEHMIGALQQALKDGARFGLDYTKLIHCFNNDDPMLDAGLTTDAMATIDRKFADMSGDQCVPHVAQQFPTEQ